ncbi:MAG TPA: SufD family Fe-S cluster assembly protein [Verrucomicrobiae bacterium]|nr:SufD family Fe-S cluster assembly protein [Verrucomicrobiae bacterium]
MQSKRLSISEAQTIVVSPSERDIEVPRGTFRYLIKQEEGEQVHTFHLRESDTQVLIVGLVEATDTDTPSLETAVVHHAPRTKAETLIKTLVRDTAGPRYRGMIRIEPGSRECESYLNHHSLLIGSKAQSWTTPSLEILNNGVKCSHAATVRTITPTDLFYLESRGLSPEDSEKLLIEAFLSDVQD